ncbi:hypothetical protein NQ117_08540 [Paenibacillus sp. SC116]|uniref:hypothetical protein n=1 Tax=Paenibacillus sp. SC116 TaxID=2968986 RepID=UPI00215B2C21|nr:hypothetical protein [Paenibacillus sp. SC116]MCR8843733.1 hypothetical protein [Paenibacillus sp. SC116]
MQPSFENEREASRRSRTKANSVSPAWFLLFWFVMIAVGITATYYYSQHMKQSMIEQVQAQTNAQISSMQRNYEQQLKQMNDKLDQLQSKVQSFNELLEFTKDNASNKTDNSNKLYSQLNEVKKQLAALQKKMDLLK